MTGTRFLASDVPTPQDCVNICIEKNPSCKAVEWWENGPNDCYDCINPSLRIEYNDDADDSYPPHVLVRPIKAAGKSSSRMPIVLGTSSRKFVDLSYHALLFIDA